MRWFEPKELLLNLRDLQVELAASHLPQKLKNLRHQRFKRHRETWHAALFSHAYSEALGLREMRFAPEEEENCEFDATLAWTASREEFAARLQLKELPPEHTAPEASLDAIIYSLRKYARVSDLIVGVFVNREGDELKITIPPLV